MPLPDAVTLRGLRFHAVVGVLPHEREHPQPLEVDVTAYRRPGATGVLDYRELYAAAADAAASRAEYLEQIGEAIAGRVLQAGDAIGVRVAVRKPHVPLPGPLDHAEVVIARGACP